MHLTSKRRKSTKRNKIDKPRDLGEVASKILATRNMELSQPNLSVNTVTVAEK
jgi:hypothetical protein